MATKSIEWKEKHDGPIQKWFGYINGVLFFEISQFKNDKFTDSLTLTSRVVPTRMLKSDDLESLQENAQLLVDEFKLSLEIENYGN